MKRLPRHSICLLILIGLCACVGKRKDDRVIRVSVLRGPSAVVFAEWMQHPPQLDGKSLRVEVYDSPEQIQAAMIKGETDIAALPMVNAANLYNKGIPYVLAGCPVWGTLYVVGKAPVTELHVFGTATTPDILTRYYLSATHQPWALDYSLTTPVEVTQGMLMGQVDAAVLSEPFVSVVLRRDTTLRILADLNHPTGDAGRGFAQTAVVLHTSLMDERQVIDLLLKSSSDYAISHPEEAIRILESRQVFAAGMLVPESLKRLHIAYVPALEAEPDVFSFLDVISHYEPKTIGGRMPDKGFITGKP